MIDQNGILNSPEFTPFISGPGGHCFITNHQGEVRFLIARSSLNGRVTDATRTPGKRETWGKARHSRPSLSSLVDE